MNNMYIRDLFLNEILIKFQACEIELREVSVLWLSPQEGKLLDKQS